jgi:D-threo-aldose 1-dehydrogenase
MMQGQQPVPGSRLLGRTDLEVGRLSFGSAPLATVFWGNDEVTAVDAVRAAIAAGISLIDTAPFYGLGEAEERVGAALRDADGADVLVATKVGRTLVGSDPERSVAFDFSADAVRRQLEGSLRRLGRDRIDIVHVHDPEDYLDQALHECVPALRALREEGLVRAISVGTNVCATALRFLREADPDVVMLAGRLTLLDRSAEAEVVPECEERGVPLLAAGVFNSGVLADPVPGRWFDYAPADARILERAKEIHRLCAQFGVDARAAAIAYPLRFAPVASVVVGMASASEVDANVAALKAELPSELWEFLGAYSL